MKREQVKKENPKSVADRKAIQTFEDLDAWKVCRHLRLKVATLSRSLPEEEHYRLNDQLIGASRSVTANLAEGYGRFYYSENIQFNRRARGSLYEILDHLTVALDEKLISQETFDEFRDDILRAIVIVNGLIRYLNRARLTDNE